MLEFTQNGILFEAGEGYAYAMDGAEKLWEIKGVFLKTAPTKNVVLTLHKAMMEAIEDESSRTNF